MAQACFAYYTRKESRTQIEIWAAVAAATWYRSLAVAQFIRGGGHPLQQRLAETNFIHPS
jgi:hypothetical protein